MADGSQRTDYMAMEEFKKRAKEHMARGDQPLGETRMLVVKFDTDFDRFAANVAYELRHLVVYASCLKIQLQMGPELVWLPAFTGAPIPIRPCVG